MKCITLPDSVFEEIYDRKKTAIISVSLPTDNVINGSEVQFTCVGNIKCKVVARIVSTKKIESIHDLTLEEVQKAGFSDTIEAAQAVLKAFKDINVLYYFSFKIIGTIET